jgi:hypothetical protein
MFVINVEVEPSNNSNGVLIFAAISGGNDDVKVALKAIELLGKHSDIALFTERSEVTVNYKTSTDLESAIKDRIKRLMNAEKISGPSATDIDVDDVLGIVDMPREKSTEEGPDVT